MNTVDPLAGKFDKRRQIVGRRQPLRLKAPHLARRCRYARGRLAADDPAHRRIVTQALGIVDIFVAGEPAEHRLSQQPDQRVSPILASARVGEHVARHPAETDSVVEFPVGQQSGIGRDPRTMELNVHVTVEIEPNSPLTKSRLTDSM